MHYMAGKSEVDAGYQEVNSSEIGQHDVQVFMEYVEENLKEDAIQFLMKVLKK